MSRLLAAASEMEIGCGGSIGSVTRGRFLLAKALLALIALDVFVALKLYGAVLVKPAPNRPMFWVTVLVVTLLVAAMAWLTVLFGRVVRRALR